MSIKNPRIRKAHELTVYASKEFHLFKLCEANRKVESRYKKIIQDIKAGMDYRADFHIIVYVGEDGYYYILDGQHRFTACKELGVEVFFVITESLTEDDILNINRNMKGIDFNGIIRIQAARGLEDYKRLVGAESEISFKTRTLLSLAKQHKAGSRDTLFDGDLEYSEEDLNHAREIEKIYMIFKKHDPKTPERYVPMILDRMIKTQGIEIEVAKTAFKITAKQFKRQIDPASYYTHFISLFNAGVAKTSGKKIRIKK